jgi:hypothetical protein
VHPMATMGQYCHPILFEPVGQQQGHTAWRSHAGHLMHHPLGQGQGAAAHID